MFSFIRFIVVGIAGLFGGLFFAQKSGKSLRKELVKSSHPLNTVLKELKKVSSESYVTVKDWAENSEEVQAFFKESKTVMKDLAKKAKELGAEASEETAKELESVAKQAKSAADDLKKGAKKAKKGFENKLKKGTKSTKSKK